jgi:hypothetical protein
LGLDVVAGTAEELEIRQVWTRIMDVVDVSARLPAGLASAPVSLDHRLPDIVRDPSFSLCVTASGDVRQLDAKGLMDIRIVDSAIDRRALVIPNPLGHLAAEVRAVDRAGGLGLDLASAVGARVI